MTVCGFAIPGDKSCSLGACALVTCPFPGREQVVVDTGRPAPLEVFFHLQLERANKVPDLILTTIRALPLGSSTGAKRKADNDLATRAGRCLA